MYERESNSSSLLLDGNKDLLIVKDWQDFEDTLEWVAAAVLVSACRKKSRVLRLELDSGYRDVRWNGNKQMCARRVHGTPGNVGVGSDGTIILLT